MEEIRNIEGWIQRGRIDIVNIIIIMIILLDDILEKLILLVEKKPLYLFYLYIAIVFGFPVCLIYKTETSTNEQTYVFLSELETTSLLL